MTYKELVDRIARVCDQHPIIRDFGYGAITDLKTMNNENGNSLVTETDRRGCNDSISLCVLKPYTVY